MQLFEKENCNLDWIGSTGRAKKNISVKVQVGGPDCLLKRNPLSQLRFWG
jgi:hypothetical protein